MSAAELLSFIPLLLYGVALADLFGQWRRFFDKDYLYWPYVLTTIIFTEIAIWNIYLFLVNVQDVELMSYFDYWTFLCQPILFLLIVHAFTPESETKDTAAYFKKRMRIVFVLFSIYIALHFLPGTGSTEQLNIARILGVVIGLIIAYTKYVPLIYAFTVVWLISLFFR